MNSIKPRLLSMTASAAVLSILSLGMADIAVASTGIAHAAVTVQTITSTVSSSDPYIAQVHNLINQKRSAAGLTPVNWNQQIGNVSQDWATHLGIALADPNFDFSTIHRSDAGGSLIPSGATWWGEIIACNYSSQAIVDAWMNSPSHKEIMLDPKATDIGIGYAIPSSGPYAGCQVAVANLAAYSRSVTPPVTPLPAVSGPVLKAIDTSGKLWNYASSGSTSLGARTEVGPGWKDAKQILSVDWNSDGKLDIVARWANGNVTMYAGIDGANYKAPIVIGNGGWQDYDIVATKLRSSDAYPGLVARTTVEGNLYYYPNTNGGAMTTPRKQLGWGGWQAMSELNVLDIDKDGKMDILARNSVGDLMLYRTNGAGTIIEEPRKRFDFGWNVMDSVSAEPNFAGPGTVGLVARSTSGQLFYYPIVNGAVGRSTMIGNGGWTGYVIAAGTIG